MKPFLPFLLLVFVSIPQNSQESVQPHMLNGFWLSDGYGLFIEFSGNELHTYELTSISCIPSRGGKEVESGSSSSTVVFMAGHAIIRIIPTDKPNVLRMHIDGAAADIVLHRTDKRPDSCERAQVNSPQENYRIFWKTFAEQYPFFSLHEVDWRAVDRKFRPLANANTRPAELFAIFRQMLEPLKDTHTGVEAEDIKTEFNGWREDPNELSEIDWKKAASIIESRYVVGSLHSYCKNRLQFGLMRNDIKYLRVTTFYGYADGGYASQLECLQQSLDAMFTGAEKRNGLVIDIRQNGGGDDPLGIEIASRLTEKKYLAFTKAARNSVALDAPLHFTELQPTWVVPSARPGFKGRVVLLIGPDTVSAGETFTMALMGREPHVIRIGLNTQGVFSDVLNRSLPNGWRFHLPNEIYFTQDGKAFDAMGVPSDIKTAFFSRADLQNERDSALEKALDSFPN